MALTLNIEPRFRQSRVEEIKNPSKSPFTKGDFLSPPFEKRGERGDFWKNVSWSSNEQGANDYEVALNLEPRSLNVVDVKGWRL